MPGEEETFLQKLGEIPVVNDGWTTAWEYYSKVKDYNALTRLSLGMAESSVKVAGKISTPVLSPVISRYQPQIDNVNDYACKKLDEIESKYPIIKQPTNEVKEACTEYIEPVVGKVKPVVSQVQGMIDNSKKQVARIKTCGTNAVVGAKDFGVGTVTTVVNATFETTPGRFVTRTIDGVLDKADNIVDKYLPEEEEKSGKAPEDESSDEDSDGDETKKAVEPMEVENPSPARVAMHLKCVSEKIRRRMYRLAVRDFRKAKSETMNALNTMSSTVKLVDYAKGNLTGARDKVEEMYRKMVKDGEKSEGDKEKESLFAGTLEERIIALGSMVADRVKSGISLMETTSAELGSFARNPITKTKEYSEVVKSFSVVRSLQDFSSERLEQLSSSLRFIQKKCRNLLEGVESPEWLNVDLEMTEMDLQDSDVGIDQAVSSNNNSENEMEREDHHVDDISRMEEEEDGDQTVEYSNLTDEEDLD